MQSVFSINTGQPSHRKAHRKSRYGCYACKARRIKCDESQPACSRCFSLKVDCVYPRRPESTSPDDAVVTRTSLPSPTNTAHVMAVSLATSDLANLLAASPHPLREDAIATDYFRTLQHFHAVTGPTFGNDMLSHIMQCVITDDAWDQPLLMHMTLAFSTAHKRHLLSQSGQRGVETNSPKMEEAYHWQQGLQLYRAEVSHVVKSSAPAKTYSDSLIAATFLTVMYAFTVDDGQQMRSVATSDELDIANVLAPVAATVGFQALRTRLGGLKGNSVWLPAVSTTRNIYESSDQGMPPRAFVELCDLNDSPSLETNPYREIVRHLTVLLRSSGTPESLSNLFGFSSRLWVSLDPMLQRRDARALLIMSWWFALLCQIKQWWTATRSREACTLIVRYLSSFPDPLMQRLLEFPKTFGESDYTWIWD